MTDVVVCLWKSEEALHLLLELTVIDECKASTATAISSWCMSWRIFAVSKVWMTRQLSSFGRKDKRDLSTESFVKALMGATPGKLWELVLSFGKGGAGD